MTSKKWSSQLVGEDEGKETNLNEESREKRKTILKNRSLEEDIPS